MKAKRGRVASIESQVRQGILDWRSEGGEDWHAATPTLRVQAFHRGHKCVDLVLGEQFDYYDWASLTKIVFSVSSVMWASEVGLKPEDSLSDWLPEVPWSNVASAKNSRRVLKLRSLLTHSAGLTWWKPFFRSVNALPSRDPELRWSAHYALVLREARRLAKRRELFPQQSVYSDLDFFFIGEILRRAWLESLSTQWARVSDRLGLLQTGFHVLRRADVEDGSFFAKDPARRRRTAPTESCPWRGRRLRGEVHDENAWALGGIAPHSGLFGPIDDLSRYGLQLRRLVRGESSSLWPVKSAGKFVRRGVPNRHGDWALGFMMPSRPTSTAGRFFSRSSVGHTGFTGTSLWYDPRADLLVALLSNRVAYGREPNLFAKLRPAVHDLIYQAVSK
ncbi:MAG TPA: serine hydrolase [Pseudobdellovibrionaceae bacterium]|nr:serine hydrolase [Pseudobdellovibrionaceae bacterium]